MPIHFSRAWKHTTLDLHAIATHAMVADATLKIPSQKRRSRLVKFGYPRHLYKFKEIPSCNNEHQRKQLEGMLLKNELFASTSDKFNDPFDTQADYRFNQKGEALRTLIYSFLLEKGASKDLAKGLVSDAQVTDPDVVAAWTRANHQEVLQQLGVCCLSAAPRDPLLWAHYAQSHRGIALQYLPCLDPEHLLPHQVQYSDTYPIIDNYFDLQNRDIFSPLLHKSSSWAYEKEWRIFRPDAPNRIFQIRPEALTGVLLGMRISAPDRDYIRILINERNKRYGLKMHVFQAEAARDKYRAFMRRLQ